MEGVDLRYVASPAASAFQERCAATGADPTFLSACAPSVHQNSFFYIGPATMAFTARSKKIVKEKGAEPDEFEESVAQVRLGQLDSLWSSA